MIPARLAGLDSVYIKNVSNNSIKDNLYKNTRSLVENISSLYSFVKKNKYVAHTIISYQESLQSLTMWYRQLWGESLGKNNRGVHIIPAMGSTDQHSQLQMWLDGPDNLFYTIILPKKRKKDFKLIDKNKFMPSYLNKKKLGPF